MQYAGGAGKHLPSCAAQKCVGIVDQATNEAAHHLPADATVLMRLMSEKRDFASVRSTCVAPDCLTYRTDQQQTCTTLGQLACLYHTLEVRSLVA